MNCVECTLLSFGTAFVPTSKEASIATRVIEACMVEYDFM